MSTGTAEVTDLVIDASIGVKWFVPEIRSEAALILLGARFRRHVPSLFFTEVAQTFWKKIYQRQTMTEDDGREGVQSLQRMPLITYPASSLLLSAFEVAMETGRTVYDCVYLALAESLNCPLVTDDLRLFNALQSGSRSALVVRLDELVGRIED